MCFSRVDGYFCLQTLYPCPPGHFPCDRAASPQGPSLGQPEAMGFCVNLTVDVIPAWQLLTCSSSSPESKGLGFRGPVAVGKINSSLPWCTHALTWCQEWQKTNSPNSPLWLGIFSFLSHWVSEGKGGGNEFACVFITSCKAELCVKNRSSGRMTTR